MANPNLLEIYATACFGLALIHTFCVHRFRKLATRFRDGSAAENLFHLLGEVEVVFGFWAAIYIAGRAAMEGIENSVAYINGLHFHEPLFVFVILSVCSTKPVLAAVSWAVGLLSRALPLKGPIAFYAVALGVGPLLGSFITEPAAMTVLALILLERFYSKDLSEKFKYATLGLLFVNVSIGGTLTSYAAPPVLMVAGPWNWDVSFMMANFGWKSALACLVSTAGTAFFFRKELSAIKWAPVKMRIGLPAWVVAVHLLFVAGIVASIHYPPVFIGLFLFFLGLYKVTGEFQEELKIGEGLLVGFFLAGLVVLGGPQRWWLEPLLTNLGVNELFWGATGLTAITDNAALTYLGAQVQGLSDAAKYALVAGAVAGGGLTVIANAPNPAGYGILNRAFGQEGIRPLGLFLGALVPTLIGAFFLWMF